MVRRRSTVRFRKGAPRSERFYEISIDLIYDFSSSGSASVGAKWSTRPSTQEVTGAVKGAAHHSRCAVCNRAWTGGCGENKTASRGLDSAALEPVECAPKP